MCVCSGQFECGGSGLCPLFCAGDLCIILLLSTGVTSCAAIPQSLALLCLLCTVRLVLGGPQSQTPEAGEWGFLSSLQSFGEAHFLFVMISRAEARLGNRKGHGPRLLSPSGMHTIQQHTNNLEAICSALPAWKSPPPQC